METTSPSHVDPAIIDYYVQLIPFKLVDLHKRLVLFSVNDDSPIPLTKKLLQRPRLVRRLQKVQSIRFFHPS